jgi:hypothetical protein
MEEEVTRSKAVMSEDEFFVFIQTEINKYRKHSEFEALADVSFDDLQHKLMEYTPLAFSLTQLQAQYRYQYKILKRSFDCWFDSKVVETQNRYNRIDVAKTKWLSSSELERITRVTNSVEYQKKLEELDGVESREKFVTSLIKNWESHNYVLGQMCQNVRSEVNTLNMENRLSH